MTFLDQASAAIRASGGRFTSQRQVIVELLAQTQGHLDADRLHQLAHQRDSSISLATVYRTLGTLKEAGLVDQRYFSPGHERTYYEPAAASEHYHFTCRECGRVIEFQTGLIEEIRHEIEASLGVTVLHTCTCFEGLCPECRERQQA